MRKILIMLTLTIFLAGSTYAIDINGVEFDIPSQYQGGEMDDGEYDLDNVFSIRRVDDNVARAIGLWAEEQEFSEDTNIENHPVRHYCQYNPYVRGNHSHAYFVSGKSVYEIAWVGEEITSDIEKLIKNAPESEIDDDAFYSVLDESYNIYKRDKIDRLNEDGEYNILEAKYQSQTPQNTPDDTRFKEILYSYYLNK